MLSNISLLSYLFVKVSFKVDVDRMDDIIYFGALGTELTGFTGFTTSHDSGLLNLVNFFTLIPSFVRLLTYLDWFELRASQ